MATTLSEYFPYDAGLGASSLESRWRAYFSQVLLDGVFRGELNGFEVHADSTGLNLKCKTGRGVVRGQFAEHTTGVMTETFDMTGVSAGQEVYVLGFLRNDFANNRIEYATTKGTAATAGSAVLPSLTQSASIWEVPLGWALLPFGATVTTAGMVTMARQWAIPTHGGGHLDSSKRESDQLAIGTSLTDMTSLTANAWVPANRRIRVEIHAQMKKSAAGGDLTVELLRSDGPAGTSFSVVDRVTKITMAASATHYINGFIIDNSPSAGRHTWKAQAQVSAGTVDVEATATRAARIVVTDIGNA